MIHNWVKPPVGIYHHFHQSWTVLLAEGLNGGVLPPGYFALVDQRAIGLIPDVLALKRADAVATPRQPDERTAAKTVSPPKTRFVSQQTDREVYARRANRVAVRNSLGELAALIEIVSPGNKDSRRAIGAFVEKTVEFISNGVNMLHIDLFPPTPRDPQGIHKLIWDEFHEDQFELPPNKPLTLAAYAAHPPVTAFVEPVAVGDALASLPLYLEPDLFVLAPLEETYQRTWDRCPREMKDLVK
jgi:hypothetical protein